MFEMAKLVDSLSIQAGATRSSEPGGGESTYERVLILTREIEEALCALQEDSETGWRMLEATVSSVVAEAHRIEGFLVLQPSPLVAVAEPTHKFRQGLEAYYEGALQLAQCLEDLDPEHLLQARRFFKQGHLALQAAKECLEDGWESDAYAA